MAAVDETNMGNGLSGHDYVALACFGLGNLIIFLRFVTTMRSDIRDLNTSIRGRFRTARIRHDNLAKRLDDHIQEDREVHDIFRDQQKERGHGNHG